MNGRNRYPNTLKTAETLLEVIDALQEMDGAGVTELARQTGLSKSSAYRHLSTLEKHEYVIREDDTYYLSYRFLNLGSYVRDRKEIHQMIKPKIKELADETGELAQFVVEDHGYGIFAYRFEGKHAVNTGIQVGERTYLNQTTAGKVILAHLPKTRVEKIIKNRGLPKRTENTITNREDLYDELDQIRERGYAFDWGEYIDTVHTVGAPLLGSEGNVLGGISVAGPKHRIKGERLENEIPNLILGTVNELELNMTYS